MNRNPVSIIIGAILLLIFVVVTILWAGYAIINFDSTPFMN